MKFPDVIHAGKPEPHNEVPQAQTAHNNFWDFQYLHTEATHMCKLHHAQVVMIYAKILQSCGRSPIVLYLDHTA